MTDTPYIPNEEILLIRVPTGSCWITEGPRVTSANFDPKPDETGISASRRSITSPAQSLELAPEPTSFRVATLAVVSVRELGLQVEPDPTPQDAGHAEIRPANKLRSSRSLRRKLARACELLP